jgi:UDP-N-acetylmuramyl tripeptide synthase
MLADITVLMDYAHNPHGIASLLSASQSIKREQVRAGGAAGRIALLLGQAGNRGDEAIADLARTAAKFHPDLIVLKEIAGMLRGRELGEVTARLMESLLAAGYPPEHLHAESDEVEAACHLLRWARPGDVLVLPIHQSAARQSLVTLLDHLGRSPWRAGLPLPAVNAVTAT